MAREIIVKNIEYDTDGKRIKNLPKKLTIVVPDEIDNDSIEDFLSDEISNITGYCHFGFDVEEDDGWKEIYDNRINDNNEYPYGEK